MVRLTFKLLAAALLVVGMTAVGFAQTESDPNVVGSREGHFFVRFPGNPSVSHETGTADGVPMYIHSAMLEQNDGKTVYLMTYSELPPAVLKAQVDQGVTDFDRVVCISQGFLDRAAAHVDAEQAITLSGFDGKEFTFSRPDGTHGKYRVFVLCGRVYQMVVGWKDVAPAADEATAFLDSFAFVR